MSLALLFGPSTVGPYVQPVDSYSYTQAKDCTIRVQTLDGTWQTIGADVGRGITPANVTLTSDTWGSKRATFDLRRDVDLPWIDLSAFTPVEIEVGGVVVWSGRIAETPVRDGADSVINVQCEGWQSHLDDDMYERIYVHTNLGDYKDQRSFPDAVLGRAGTAAGQVNVDGGNLVLSFPRGTDFVASTQAYAGAVLDLGPYNLAKRIVFDVMAPSRTGSGGYWGFHCRFSDSPKIDSTAINDVYTNDITALSTSTATTIAATSATARRYVMFFLYHSSGSTFTSSEDNTVRISSSQVFTDTAYESSNASALKADAVVKDALNRATLKFSSDQSSVTTGTFNIPELAPSEPKTPRQMWDAVDAFEDRYKKIDVLQRPIYKAKPTTPEVEVGGWSTMEFEDASANSGDDIYSRVIITGTKADGTPLRVSRSQGEQTGAALSIANSPSFTNPSFDTNTTGWTAAGGSAAITRDTATFDSSPASGRFDTLSYGSTLTATFSGTFVARQTYVLKLRVRYSSGIDNLRATFGSATDYATTAWKFDTSRGSAFATYSVTWTPATTTSSVNLVLTKQGLGSGYFWIDTGQIWVSASTMVDRRSFVKTKTINASFTLTDEAATQIADKWLLSHKTSPFRGKAKITGTGSIREILTGRKLQVEEMLLRTGELIRFTDKIDPDTGAIGRDGRIVEAQYDFDADTVDITIDSSRAGFDALLERLGVVLGQIRT